MKKFNNRIKKILYNNFGIVWQKFESIGIIKGEGKFTIDKLIKTYNLKAENFNLLIMSYPYHGDKNKYTTKIVQINPDLKNVDLLRSYRFYDVVNTFCTKQDFETCRKDEDVIFWIVEVKPEAIKNNKKINIEHEIMYNRKNLNERFIVEGKAYIKLRQNYNAIDINKNGKIYPLNITIMHGRLKINEYDTENGLKYYVLQDVLDKSGYPVYQYRERLKGILRQRKQVRLNCAIETGQLDEQNDRLLKLILETKNIFSEKLKNTSNFADLRKIKNLDQLEAMMTKYETHLRMQQNALNDEIREWDKYTSLQEWTDAYWSLKKEFIEVQTLIEEA